VEPASCKYFLRTYKRSCLYKSVLHPLSEVLGISAFESPMFGDEASAAEIFGEINLSLTFH
jgi:hypothetical protein